MWNFSFWEMLVVLVIALLVIGPKRLPGVARSIGGMFNKLRNLSHNLKQEFDEGMREADKPSTNDDKHAKH